MEDYDNYSIINSNIYDEIINLHMKKNVIIEENEMILLIINLKIHRQMKNDSDSKTNNVYLNTILNINSHNSIYREELNNEEILMKTIF